MTENSPNLMENINLYVPEAQQTPSRMNTEILTRAHPIGMEMPGTGLGAQRKHEASQGRGLGAAEEA